MKDNLGQDVNIGDWIATIPIGYRSVVIGKVISISKLGYPMIKKDCNSKTEAVGKTIVHEIAYDTKYISGHNPTGYYYKEVRKPHFIKVLPTKEIELNYENS